MNEELNTTTETTEPTTVAELLSSVSGEKPDSMSAAFKLLKEQPLEDVARVVGEEAMAAVQRVEMQMMLAQLLGQGGFIGEITEAMIDSVFRVHDLESRFATEIAALEAAKGDEPRDPTGAPDQVLVDAMARDMVKSMYHGRRYERLDMAFHAITAGVVGHVLSLIDAGEEVPESLGECVYASAAELYMMSEMGAALDEPSHAHVTLSLEDLAGRVWTNKPAESDHATDDDEAIS